MSNVERIAALSPERLDLLMRLLHERSAPAPADSLPEAEIPSIPEGPFDPQAPAPLSEAQTAYWMGGSGLYDLGGSSANVYIEYEVAGSASELIGRLNPALARAVARHPMLRTVITADGMQRVLAETPAYEIELVSLSQLSDEEIENRLKGTRERLLYTRHPGDRWPLFDLAVHQLPGNMTRFQACFNAVLVDGTSRNLLIDELIRGVLNEEEGARWSDPPAPEVSYVDFARALQAFRHSATWERCRAYWQERLPSLPSAPRLPIARDFGPETVPRIVWRNVTVLEPAPWATLCRRAAQRGITPSGIGAAMVAEAIRLWSEEPSFTLGLIGYYQPPVHPQIRQVIGTFVTLYLLVAEEAAGPFAERARRLQDRLSTDLEHEHFSGHEALRELNRMRRAGGRATLPIHFTSLLRSGAPSPDAESEETEKPERRPQQVELRQLDLMITMPQVLLFWVLDETSDRSLVLISQAVEEVFPPDLVTDLIDGCRRLAVRLAEDEAAWSEPRPLRLPAAARAKPETASGAGEPTLAELFAAQARARPEAPALVTAERTLSYGELDRWSLDPEPGAEPGWQQVAAALAGLRSGPGRDGLGGVEAAAHELGRLAGLGPGDRLLASSLPGSDLWLCEIFGALAAGATVVLPEPAEREPGALAAFAARERVTVWSSTPAVLEAALHEMEQDGRRVPPSTLRRVLLHRDRVPAGLPARLHALGRDVQAFVTWGTTGAPIAAAGPLRESEAAGSCLQLRAAAGWGLQVLDRDLTPRPVWVPGDLYLVGGAATGEKLRTTGERARRLPDDRIELLGDEPAPPVEALGYGADPRRVEAALQRHPAVRHAVVVWREPERRLAAWLLLRSGKEPSDRELCDHLGATFPEHLVPAAFVRLEAFSLTPEGLVDRSALVIPAEAPRRADAAWSPLEAELAGLWEDVLGRRPAARDDDFFELGGNSLSAMRLMGRLRERFGLERPLPRFLSRPTLGQLAELVDRARTERSEREERLKTTERPPLRRLRDSLAAFRARILPPPTSPAYNMRIYLLLWFSQFVSGVGTGLGAFALGVWVYRQNTSATQYSIFAFVATCTGMLVGPLAGVLADRWDRKRLILLGDSGAAVMTSLMALALYTGQLRLWHVYIIIVVMVGFHALQGPAFVATVSQLVSRRQLVRVSGMTQAAGITTGLVCPPLSGVLIPIIGYHGVIAIDISTFFFAFLVLLFIRLPRTSATTASRERRSMLGDFRFGWDYLRQRPGLLSLLWVFAATNFALSIVQVLLTPLILSFGSATSLGIVNTAMVAGSLIGSLVLTAWGGPQNRVAGILLFLLLQAPLLLLGALKPNVMLIAVACFIFALLSPLIGGLSQAIWQSKVAHDIQGRVFAMRGLIASSTAPLAFLLAGPLADRVFGPLMVPGGALADTVGRIIGVGKGRGVVLLFMTLGLVLILVVVLASLNPRLRKVESELPDATPDSEDAADKAPTETRLLQST